jgi:hypothetical protein
MYPFEKEGEIWFLSPAADTPGPSAVIPVGI